MPSPAGDATSSGSQDSGSESSDEPIVVNDDGSEENFRCKCTGITFDAECQYRATQEDGWCDRCRQGPGICCEDMKHPAVQHVRKVIYDIEKDFPRPWRPDLVPRLHKALDGWDPEEWEELVRNPLDPVQYKEKYGYWP